MPLMRGVDGFWPMVCVMLFDAAYLLLQQRSRHGSCYDYCHLQVNEY